MATTIREILDRLSEKDRSLLEYCHESDIPNFIKADGLVIGVYFDRLTGIKPAKMTAGDWFVSDDSSNS